MGLLLLSGVAAAAAAAVVTPIEAKCDFMPKESFLFLCFHLRAQSSSLYITKVVLKKSYN